MDLQSLNSSTVEVFWKVLENSEFLEGILIHYRPTQDIYELFDTENIIEVHEESHLLDKLRGSTEYEVFIQPYYKELVGLPTQLKRVTTKPGEIPRKPVVLIAEMINITTAFVVWQPISQDIIAEYEVMWK